MEKSLKGEEFQSCNFFLGVKIKIASVLNNMLSHGESHPSGPSNAFCQGRNLPLSHRYYTRLTTHPNDQVLALLAPPGTRRLRRHMPNDLPGRFAY
jgi:hypothetical protein